MFDSGHWFRIEGSGYSKSGAILGAAGAEAAGLHRAGVRAHACAPTPRVADDGAVMGDPTEAALVVLAAKMGVDAEISRREYDGSRWCRSTRRVQVHGHVPPGPHRRQAVPGGTGEGRPGRRCSPAARRADWLDGVVPIDEVADRIQAANDELGSQGLRVMSFAYRHVRSRPRPSRSGRPDGGGHRPDLRGAGGHHRPAAAQRRRTRSRSPAAGIDVRMITGDHAVTAQAIADDLGLGPGVITGTGVPAAHRRGAAASPVDELHVFGRVAPEDKLRLVSVMQQPGRHRGDDRRRGQ